MFRHAKSECRPMDNIVRDKNLNNVRSMKVKWSSTHVTPLDFLHRSKSVIFGLFLAVSMVLGKPHAQLVFVCNILGTHHI